MKKMICVLCVVCVCFSMIVTPIAAQVADITAEQASYYPGLTQTTRREEADVIRVQNFSSETYYKVTDPTTGTNTRTSNSWFPTTSANSSVSIQDFLNGEVAAPNGIIGDDDRTIVWDTSSTPYSAIAQIVSYYEGETADTYGYSTGVMIGPNVMLTAAHCIYDSESGWAYRAKVYPGVNDYTSTYLGYAWVADVFMSPYWIDYEYPEFDWAILILASNIGTETGWFGISYSNSLLGTQVTVTGYPSDVEDESGYWMQLTDTSTVTEVNTYTISHNVDTYKGQSGAPIYDSNYRIVAIHTSGNNVMNYGTRITNKLFDIIEAIVTFY